MLAQDPGESGLALANLSFSAPSTIHSLADFAQSLPHSALNLSVLICEMDGPWGLPL